MYISQDGTVHAVASCIVKRKEQSQPNVSSTSCFIENSSDRFVPLLTLSSPVTLPHISLKMGQLLSRFWFLAEAFDNLKSDHRQD